MGIEPTYADVRRMVPEEFQGYIAEKIDRYHGEALSVGVQVASIQKRCDKRGLVCRGIISGGLAIMAGAWAWAKDLWK